MDYKALVLLAIFSLDVFVTRSQKSGALYKVHEAVDVDVNKAVAFETMTPIQCVLACKQSLCWQATMSGDKCWLFGPYQKTQERGESYGVTKMTAFVPALGKNSKSCLCGNV